MRRLIPALTVLLVLLEGAGSRSPRYYLDRGNKLVAAGKYDDAVLTYRKAIQADANFGEAYDQLGSTLWRLRRTQEAYAMLLRAVELLPSRDDVKVKLAALELSSYLSDSHHPAAIRNKINDLCNQVLAADADSFDGLRLKAHLAAFTAFSSASPRRKGGSVRERRAVVGLVGECGWVSDFS